MNAVRISLLSGVILVGCAAPDPIDRLVANPPDEASKPTVISMPPNATPEQVLKECLAPRSRWKILKTRKVSFGGRLSPTAVLVEMEGGKPTIMLVVYVGADRGGWWIYTCDAQ